MTRRPAIVLSRCFYLFLALAVLGGFGICATPGQAGEKVSPQPGPVLEGKIQDKIEEPSTPTSAVTLDPFFLITEDGSQVRVRRVQVALEFSQSEMLPKFDPQSPVLREKVYDFLADKEQVHSGREQEKVLAQLVNRYLGQEAVSAVKVDQSFLLLR